MHCGHIHPDTTHAHPVRDAVHHSTCPKLKYISIKICVQGQFTFSTVESPFQMLQQCQKWFTTLGLYKEFLDIPLILPAYHSIQPQIVKCTQSAQQVHTHTVQFTFKLDNTMQLYVHNVGVIFYITVYKCKSMLAHLQ